ncbi:hypothetical protein DPEC_G00236780 [Dallia pectoralis]|uniref:Uncharacterized protein n=1 Tax=Dallia pectoralis TaxID=75939 RepID=A0ACC2FYF0_DALPE|nr:hypothetical protein DPEC_G00236780 [Dallia pectoralis]
MKGRHNSVISRLKTSQPHVQDLGCICHLVQLATRCGIRAAQVPVEDILVGIYTHCDKWKCCVYKRRCHFSTAYGCSNHLSLKTRAHGITFHRQKRNGSSDNYCSGDDCSSSSADPGL